MKQVRHPGILVEESIEGGRRVVAASRIERGDVVFWVPETTEIQETEALHPRGPPSQWGSWEQARLRQQMDRIHAEQLARGVQLDEDALGAAATHSVRLALNMHDNGLFTEACVLNHSCRPNALQRVLVDPTGARWLEVRTVADVLPGQELQVSYLPNDFLYASAAARRATLHEHYGFECRCERCEASNLAHEALALEESLLALGDAISSAELAEEEARLGSWHPQMHALQSRLLPVWMQRVREAESQAARALAERELMFLLGRLVEGQRSQLHYDPERGAHLELLASLLFSLGRDSEAHEVMDEAIELAQLVELPDDF